MLFGFFFHGFPYRIECLFSDDVLDAAGVVVRRFLIHAETDQPFPEELMPVIHSVSQSFAALCKSDISLFGYADVALFLQILYCDADAGLGESHLIRDVYASDYRFFFTYDEDRLQIILNAFIMIHYQDPPGTDISYYYRSFILLYQDIEKAALGKLLLFLRYIIVLYNGGLDQLLLLF